MGNGIISPDTVPNKEKNIIHIFMSENLIYSNYNSTKTNYCFVNKYTLSLHNLLSQIFVESFINA